MSPCHSHTCHSHTRYFTPEAVITITVHQGDLPDSVSFSGPIAVDTETMGLIHRRDRLCLVQLSGGDGNAHLVQLAAGEYDAPNLKRVLGDPKALKIFHFARFDLAAIWQYLGVMAAPAYCTRTASRLARTYTDKHGYKEICKELLGVDISKQQQSSDWGSAALSKEQKEYAAADVLHLHKLREKLDEMLSREGRTHLAQACFDFLPHRAAMDVAGFDEGDIFAHT